jgi:predicted kinase
MNKPVCLMLVGLPGSGKSTIAKEYAITYNANIYSSDAIREELSGDINNQNINDLVFQTLHNRIKEDLLNGKNCIYDACNISYKRRMAFLQELNKIPCMKLCVLVATPYKQCKKNNISRDRTVPDYVIERMYHQFDPPYWYEGWDDITIEYTTEDYWLNITDWLKSVKDYNQNNSHHNLTLGEHCRRAVESLHPQVDKDYERIKFPSSDLIYATVLHDCGKPFCKTFKNTKGEVTEQAHYYAHEHTSSYDSLFYMEPSNHLYVSILIRWHMQPYYWEKDNNEKLQNKYCKLWGEQLYEDIMQLHQADKAAH